MDGYGDNVAEPACLDFLKRAGGPECGPGKGGPTCGDRVATFILCKPPPAAQPPRLPACQSANPSCCAAVDLLQPSFTQPLQAYVRPTPSLPLTAHHPPHAAADLKSPTRGGQTAFPEADITKQAMGSEHRSGNSPDEWYCGDSRVLAAAPPAGTGVLFW